MPFELTAPQAVLPRHWSKNRPIGFQNGYRPLPDGPKLLLNEESRCGSRGPWESAKVGDADTRAIWEDLEASKGEAIFKKVVAGFRFMRNMYRADSIYVLMGFEARRSVCFATAHPDRHPDRSQ